MKWQRDSVFELEKKKKKIHLWYAFIVLLGFMIVTNVFILLGRFLFASNFFSYHPFYMRNACNWASDLTHPNVQTNKRASVYANYENWRAFGGAYTRYSMGVELEIVLLVNTTKTTTKSTRKPQYYKLSSIRFFPEINVVLLCMKFCSESLMLLGRSYFDCLQFIACSRYTKNYHYGNVWALWTVWCGLCFCFCFSFIGMKTLLSQIIIQQSHIAHRSLHIYIYVFTRKNSNNNNTTAWKIKRTPTQIPLVIA